MEKYRLTMEKDVCENYGRCLYRIIAVRDFGNIKAGSLGGLVSSKDNLSEEGSCWVYPHALVVGNARVCGDAVAEGNAVLSDEAVVCDHARICDHAKVSGQAKIKGYAVISEFAEVTDRAVVEEDAQVNGSARVLETAVISDHAVILDCAKIGGSVKVCGDAQVGDFIELTGSAVVFETICTADTEAPVEGKPEPKPVESKPIAAQKLRKTVEEYRKAWHCFLVSFSITVLFFSICAITAFSTESSLAISLFSIFSGVLTAIGFVSSSMYCADLCTCEKDLQYLTKEEQPALCNLTSFCTELQALEKQIQNEELRGVLVGLLQALEESKEWEADLHEVHLSETLGLLRKYIALGKEKPEGYEDFTKYLCSVQSQVEEVTARRFQMKEASFAADASALAESIGLQKW